MKRLTNSEFLVKCISVHGNDYDYSLVDYVNSTKHVKIICPEHGVFEPIANNFINGSGCPVCSNRNKNKKLSMSIDDFKSKSNVAHNGKYDYSLVNYINNKTKVKIICPEHGVFEQRPDMHLLGKGCNLCGGSYKKNNIIFINESISIHNNKYDYSLVNYINNKTKVKIICPEHGVFEQIPKSHLLGSGCHKCCNNYKLTRENFIAKSNETHRNKYDYSLVDYHNTHTEVDILCKEHGVFSQKAYKHMYGNGCPNCKYSKSEELISYILIENNIKFEREKTIDNCVYKNKLRFDFYLSDFDIYIEYDGEQHFRPIANWGGEKSYEVLKKRDYIKDRFCENNNIKLFRISYKDDIIRSLCEILSVEIS